MPSCLRVYWLCVGSNNTVTPIIVIVVTLLFICNSLYVELTGANMTVLAIYFMLKLHR